MLPVSLVLQQASLGMIYGDDRGARESTSRNMQGFWRPKLRFGTRSCLLNFIWQWMLWDWPRFRVQNTDPAYLMGGTEGRGRELEPSLYSSSLSSLFSLPLFWLYRMERSLLKTFSSLAPAIPSAQDPLLQPPGLAPVHTSLSLMIWLFSDLTLPPLWILFSPY